MVDVGKIEMSRGAKVFPPGRRGREGSDAPWRVQRWGGAGRDAQMTAANTNDLRGKIIRIHPEINGTYTVPTGNMQDLPVFASLSAADKAKVKPEIYSMGHRNPYRLGVDRYRSWVMWFYNIKK